MPTILIIAQSARPYLQKACIPYNFITIDGFADRETRALAIESYICPTNEYGFVPEQLLGILAQLNYSDCIGLIYGSGFEAQPELLKKLEEYLPVLGNSAELIRPFKTRESFFSLLDRLNILYPETSFVQPKNLSGWLKKKIDGTGGVHIRLADETPLRQNEYYQRQISGYPVSLLCFAHPQQLTIVGFHQTLHSPTQSYPYRYGGLSNAMPIAKRTKDFLINTAQKLCQAQALKGSISLDAVDDGENCYLLEVNPRLSASWDLYREYPLFDWHLASCRGEICQISPQITSKRKRIDLVYAEDDTMVSDETIFPINAKDIPPIGKYVAKGEPFYSLVQVCTQTS